MIELAVKFVIATILVMVTHVPLEQGAPLRLRTTIWKMRLNQLSGNKKNIGIMFAFNFFLVILD